MQYRPFKYLEIRILSPYVIPALPPNNLTSGDFCEEVPLVELRRYFLVRKLQVKDRGDHGRVTCAPRTRLQRLALPAVTQGCNVTRIHRYLHGEREGDGCSLTPGGYFGDRIVCAAGTLSLLCI